MSGEIDYKVTRDEAKKIAKTYCEQHGYSYERLSNCDLHYGICSSGEHHWIWRKPYNGPIKDENGCFLDLQIPLELVLKIIYIDGIIKVEELNYINFIR